MMSKLCRKQFRFIDLTDIIDTVFVRLPPDPPNLTPSKKLHKWNVNKMPINAASVVKCVGRGKGCRDRETITKNENETEIKTKKNKYR